MASSKVSSMLLFLLLLVLVFPHMDKALGEERQLHELKGTEHPDQLMTVGRSLLFASLHAHRPYVSLVR
ncbi:unnamed protein product [Brassica napus]|uniref:(rape) hypothetical protein n=1 Tax=Brassica napus TaxID=3708 RepID=A0A816QRC6_BRANA|nr:unnamed protein product [Brassica napus]